VSNLSPEIKQAYDRDVVDIDGFEAWLANHGYAWQAMERGEYGFSLEEAQLRYLCEDPVLWCKAFMSEPDTGDPYEFWPYQQESIRHYYQDAVHQDGAEVGKKPEMVGTVLWGMITGFGYTVKNPSMLIAAPQQTHLDEIIMAIEEHVGEGEGTSGEKPLINRFWVKPKRTPHTMFRFRGSNCTANKVGRVYFRPAGHDGEAFRGVHVNAGGMFDEAAKVKSKVIWSEFHRALMPGAFTRYYSVPDGDNTTEFYRYTKEAKKDLKPGQPGLRLFQWPKTIMPAPFWDDARDKKMQERYGGKDTPGYQRNRPGPAWSTRKPGVAVGNVGTQFARRARVSLH